MFVFMLLLIPVKNWIHCKWTLQLESSVCFILFSVFDMHFSDPTIFLCFMEWWYLQYCFKSTLPKEKNKKKGSMCDDDRFLRNETSGLPCICKLRHKGPAEIFSNRHPPNSALCPEKEYSSESIVKLLWFPQTWSSGENFLCHKPLVRYWSNIIN